jgi:beta-phosphoglucomutase-like phosphatase (HAD superfamily)
LIKDEINQRAYEISIQRGIAGDAFSDWLQAEREIFQKYNIQKPEKEIKMMKDRKQYIDKISAQFKDWDDEIKKLKTKAETVKAESKEKYKELLNDYSVKKEAAQKKLQELKNSSEDSWKE